jgi:hypothetical protein
VHATVLELPTPHGLARAHLHEAADATGAVVLGHGAGGSVTAPDLQAATRAALDCGASVALVEQPYRVAGRRSAPPAQRLDAAWTAAVGGLRAGPLAGVPLIAGGRSAGARVACRTASDSGAAGVLCLAFPLQPPRRASGTAAASRLPELDAVRVPVLVVQGAHDHFGVPPRAPGRTVVEVSGTHSLRGDLEPVRAAVGAWLRSLLD